MTLITSKETEALIIMQEECTEVAQVISKIFRFGLDEAYDNRTNRRRLEEEIGDLLCMIEILEEQELIDMRLVQEAKSAKRIKLEQWTTHLFKKEL
jgi:NTP pyrophosphatase (non-canonical NTP hydrolase)